MKDVAEFIRAHCPPLAEWEPGRLEEWLGWFAHHRLLLVARENGKVVGVGAARRVASLAEGQTDYRHDEAAPVVFVDLVVASEPGVLRQIWRQFRVRFPWVTGIAWSRVTRGREATKVHNVTQVEGLIYGKQ